MCKVYVFLIAFVAVLALIVFYLTAPNIILGEFGGPAEFGQFGDYIGGLLNPIFGFITVCLLLYSNQVQKKVSRLSEREYDRKQIEDALSLAYDRLALMLRTRLNDRIPMTAA